MGVTGKLCSFAGGDDAGIVIGLDINAKGARQADDVLRDFERNAFSQQKAAVVAVIDLISVCRDDDGIGKKKGRVFSKL